MSPFTARPPITLAIHPSVGGFGWIALEGPLTIYDCGLAFTRTDKNANCLKRLERMLDRMLPETLVLEAFEAHQSLRRARITKLCRAIVALATARGIEMAIYDRADIGATFAGLGAKSRQEIAEAIGRQLPALQRHVPPRRRAWDREPDAQCLFSATAAALTHYRLSCARLFDALKEDD